MCKFKYSSFKLFKPNQLFYVYLNKSVLKTVKWVIKIKITLQ